jgi:hypothetical protein
MQVFTKKLLIAFLAIFLGLSVISCNKDETTTEEPTDEAEMPTLSNPDKIFMSTDDYSVTYGELYDEVKVNDGLNQLLNLVDTDLLSDYIPAVTDTDIENKTLVLTYGTDDPDEIADFSDEEVEELERTFDDSMYLLGFTTEATVESYVRLIAARENYALEQMNDSSNSEEVWYAGPSNIASYYAANYTSNIKTIKVRFMSESDANSVLRLFNLVSMDGELKLFTGATPVPSSELDETNTATLTANEILDKFIELYNYVYGDLRDEISIDASLATLLANEDLDVEYDNIANASASLATFIYESLGTFTDYTTSGDDLLYYTYEPVKYYSSNDTSYYMILNLDKTDAIDVEDFSGTEAELVALIGQDLYDEIEQEIIDANYSSSSFVSNIMAYLRAEHGFVVYDKYLGIDYSMVYSEFEVNEDGHTSLVASYDSIDISADDLFTFAFSVNAPLYTIYAVQSKAVVSAHFEDIYCTVGEECEFDVLENTSDIMTGHNETYVSLEEQFEESYYATYYTFDEYLYLAYGIRTYYEMIFDYYVTSTLQPFIIYDEVTNNDYDILNHLMELSRPYYDNYFSLDVEHILIYVDRNEDGSPDDYEEFYEGLEDTTEYDGKLEDFVTAIETYLEDSENTMTLLVAEYKSADRDDATWGEFKTYGFYILTEDLGELTYTSSVSTFEMPFVDGLIDLYEDYNLVANENEEMLLAEELVETSYGLHLIKAEKGAAFEMPSALFAMTYEIGIIPDYDEAVVNTEVEVSLEQLKIWADYRFTVLAAGIGDLEEIYGLSEPELPESVLVAIETFYQEMYDALYVVGYLNNIVIDQLHVADYDNEHAAYSSFTEAEFQNILTEVSELYMYQIFAALDQRDTK